MHKMQYLLVGLIFVYAANLVMRSECEAMPVTAENAAQYVVKGNNAFALSLYSQLKRADGNLFFSPYSISGALAMTYAGARGETAEEMAEALRFDLPPDLLHPAFAELNDRLKSIQDAGDVALSIANALWLQEGVELLKEFVALTTEHYEAGVFPVDFMKAAQEARQRINGWVEEQTQEKIKDLLPPGSVDELTRLVLTNAIYFKGNWEKEFEKDQTQKESFYVSPDEKVEVSLMQQQSNFKYGETETAQILQLPYEGETLAMLIALPKAQDGLATLESELTAETMESWQQELAMREVKITIPRFSAETSFELSESLKALGMSQAFTEAADFSGIDGTKQLSISGVLHKAFIDVTEEGTEAAAATAVIIGVTSVRDPAPIPEFRADHPFLYLIRDLESGSILFLGRCVNPTERK